MIQLSNTIGGPIHTGIARGGRSLVARDVLRPDPRQARHAVGTLRRSVARLELPDAVRSGASRAIAEIEQELQLPDPDRGVVTARLEQLTELLTDAGAIEAAGASLARPIRIIATWLGPRPHRAGRPRTSSSATGRILRGPATSPRSGRFS